MTTRQICQRALMAAALCTGPGMFAGDAYAADITELRQAVVDEGNFYANFRYRYENVEQDNALKDAHASTLRIKSGYKTGMWNGFSALAEIEASLNAGPENYNDTVNGKATHSVVADPNQTELNQLWLSYVELPGTTTIKAGRQGLGLDNERFIGGVLWRQLDQTYDGVTLTNTGISRLALLYSYFWNVNRINGDDHPLGDLGTNTHIFHAAYGYADWLHVSAYGYLLDMHDAPALSSSTYGARLTGTHPLTADWRFSYALEMAEQSDYENNPASYDATYFYAAPAAHWNGFTFEAGFERFEGDGANSVQTPLATLHGHSGWTDQFLTTPGNGLEDTYGKIAYTFSGVNEWIDGTYLEAVYHDFDSERGGMDYGDEINLLATKTFRGKGCLESWSATLKYADYNADTFSVDTTKYWLMLGFQF